MRAAPEGAEAQGPYPFYRLGPADRPPRALLRDIIRGQGVRVQRGGWRVIWAGCEVPGTALSGV